MRNAALLSVGILLVLVQGRLLAFLPFAGATPSLALPFVIFLGVHEHSMARGALLAFALGYANDLLASAPIGLFAFVYVALWWLARVAGVRLTAQTHITKALLSFAFSLAESVIILTLLAIFGADPQRPLEITQFILPRACTTALLAPLVFLVAQRVHYSPTAAERGEAAT